MNVHLHVQELLALQLCSVVYLCMCILTCISPALSQQSQSQGRGRVIFSVETASKFRLILDDFVAEYQRLGPDVDNNDSERLKT